MIKIMLADDHTLVRDGIRMLLENQPDFEVIATATTGEEVLAHLERGICPDVLLCDINLDSLDGLELTKIINGLPSTTPIVILSTTDHEQYIAQSFKAGAAGFLVKNVSSDELLFCLRHVASGGRFLCEEISMRFVAKAIQNPLNYIDVREKPQMDLTVREIEILEKLSEGFTNSEISEQLFLSKRTVEGHRQNLLQKTGSKNTAALIKFAMLNGLIA